MGQGGPRYSEPMAGTHLIAHLLGRFSVEIDGVVVPDAAWRQRRAAALVQMLALAPGHRLVREQVIEALWPHLPPHAGTANLRKAAHHARRALGVDDGIVLAGGMVELLPRGTVTTDVERFETAARQALRGDDVRACRDAAGRYRADLLPDERYARWCEAARQRLRDLYLEVLSGGEMWGRVLEIAPADERAHREVMRGHLRTGDRSAAIRQFERMRSALAEAFGVSPDADSIAVYEQVLAMDGRDVPTPAERARALLAWGVVHWERSDLEEGRRAASEARALAIDAGLGRELADASELLGLISHAQGSWRELFATTFLETVERSAELAPFVLDANMCLSEFALEEADGVQATAGFARDLLAAAGDGTSQQARALGLLLRGEAALLAGGDLAQACADLAESARLHEAAGSTTGRARACERLALARAAQGNLELAARLHREALALARASAVPNHLLLFVHGGMLKMVTPHDAEPIVREGERVADAMQVCEPCAMSFRVGATIACARTGDLERARRHAADAERAARLWRDGPWHAAVAEARSVLRAAEGAPAAEPVALLQQAARRFAAAHRPRDAQRCRTAAAALV